MSALDNRLRNIQDVQDSLLSLMDRIDKKGGSGGGEGSGMEHRVNRIEARLDKATDGLADVKTGLATLTERVGHLPSKGFIVSCTLGSLAAITALVTFGEKLQALIK